MASYPQHPPPRSTAIHDMDRSHQSATQMNRSPYHTKYTFETSASPDTQPPHIHGTYPSSNQRLPYFVAYPNARAPPPITAGPSPLMNSGHDVAATGYKEPVLLGNSYSPTHRSAGLIKPQPNTPVITSSPIASAPSHNYHHPLETRHSTQTDIPSRSSFNPHQLRAHPVAHGGPPGLVNQSTPFIGHPPLALFETLANRSPVRQAAELSQMQLPSLRGWANTVPSTLTVQSMVTTGGGIQKRRESLDILSPSSVTDSKQPGFIETKAPITSNTTPERAPLLLSSPLRHDRTSTPLHPMLPPALLPPVAISATQPTSYSPTLAPNQVASTSPIGSSPLMTPQRNPSVLRRSFTGSPSHYPTSNRGDLKDGEIIDHAQGLPMDRQDVTPQSVKLNDQVVKSRSDSLTDTLETVPLSATDGSPDSSREMNVIELPNGVKGEKPEKQIFECPGCDLTFTRLSALRQHMLSHTGEKPHACDHCGRRFSLASNLRRHTSTKACKVLKFQEVKEKEANVQSVQPLRAIHPPVPQPAPYPHSNVLTVARDEGRVSVALDSQNIRPAAASPPPVTKKRKASTNGKPALRRKRHANNEPRWIPNTLRSFHNAHFLTSTAPFRFYTYKPRRIPSTNELIDDPSEPFTRPTLPLHPVRRSIPSRHRSTPSSSSSTSSSGSDGGVVTSHDEEEEERNSYDPCPEYPYHPSSWNDHWQRLPGPGLLGEDELIHRPSIARRWMSFKP